MTRKEEWRARRKEWEALPEDTRLSWRYFENLWNLRRDTGLQLWDEHGRTQRHEPDEQRVDK